MVISLSAGLKSVSDGLFQRRPYGEKLHVVEKYTRRDSMNLDYTVTIDDPEYYTKPWMVTTSATYRPNDRLKEYVCQEIQGKLAN